VSISKRAEANDYTTNMWTVPRAAEVIKRVTGVSYHSGDAWYILRRQRGWTWQRPSRRAVERDDEPIAQWVKGSAIKKVKITRQLMQSRFVRVLRNSRVHGGHLGNECGSP
jgi:winged helix-turn-helix protein